MYNTLVKPPCCNGGPEDKLPIAGLTDKPLWFVENFELIENNAPSYSEVTLKNITDNTEIMYEDICSAVRQFNESLGAGDIDEIAVDILTHYKTNPKEQQEFLDIVKQYAGFY